MTIYHRRGLGEADGFQNVLPGEERRQSLLTMRVGWRGVLAVVALIAVFRLWAVESVIVDGNSMSSTLLSNEWVLVLKLLRPHRFSVIVFTDPQTHTTVIKRVIGMPGDTLSRLPNGPDHTVLPGTPVVINGVPYEEPYTRDSRSGIIPETTVPEGSYYVLGDNRGDSVDSRAYGPISQKSIKGVGYAVVFPFSEMRVIPTEAEPGVAGAGAAP